MTIDASVLENLRDAGCDEGMIERCRRIAAETPDERRCQTALTRLLTPHRRALLDALHADQAKLNCMLFIRLYR